MWLIIICIVVILLYSLYYKDRKDYRNKISSSGGMKELFAEFILALSSTFTYYEIAKLTENELEIKAENSASTTYYFGIKLGFSSKVLYRCDTKPNTYLNADIAIEGNIQNQLKVYNLIVSELHKRGKLP